MLLATRDDMPDVMTVDIHKIKRSDVVLNIRNYYLLFVLTIILQILIFFEYLLGWRLLKFVCNVPVDLECLVSVRNSFTAVKGYFLPQSRFSKNSSGATQSRVVHYQITSMKQALSSNSILV